MRNINVYLFITLLLLSMQTFIALRFYATDTFPVCDWRLIWRQCSGCEGKSRGSATVKYRRPYAVRQSSGAV